MAGPAFATDPVCHMTVALTADALAVDHRGHTYYFCEPACATVFRRDPERWAPKEVLASAGSTGASTATRDGARTRP